MKEPTLLGTLVLAGLSLTLAALLIMPTGAAITIRIVKERLWSR